MARPPSRRETSVLLTRYWLPVLLYLAVIFSLSAQPNLKPPFQFDNSDKLCHLLEYGGLGFMLARALHASRGARLTAGMAGLALAMGSLVGVADERFQGTVPGRDSSPLDWAADTAGVTLSLAAYAWRVRGGEEAPSWL